MTKNLTAVLLTCGAIAMVGCAGGSKAPAAANIPTVTPSATSPAATPATTPPQLLTMAQARQAYLRLVKPYNDELKAAEQATSFAVYRQDALKLKRLARAIADGMRATRWPATVQPTATRFADAIAGDVLYWLDQINARSFDEANAVSNTPHNNAAKAAEQMRETLGLPSIS